MLCQAKGARAGLCPQNHVSPLGEERSVIVIVQRGRDQLLDFLGMLTDSHADTHVIWVQTLVLVGQLCLTLCNPVDYIAARPLCPWNFPGKNTGVR